MFRFRENHLQLKFVLKTNMGYLVKCLINLIEYFFTVPVLLIRDTVPNVYTTPVTIKVDTELIGCLINKIVFFSIFTIVTAEILGKLNT